MPQIHILRMQPPSRYMLPPLPAKTIPITVLSKSRKTDVSVLQTFNFSHDILYILADKSRLILVLVFFVYLCACTHTCVVCAQVCLCAFVHACMCAGQRLMSGILAYHLPPWFLRQGLPWNLTLTIPAAYRLDFAPTNQCYTYRFPLSYPDFM